MSNRILLLLKSSAMIAACLTVALVCTGGAFGSEVSQLPTLAWTASLPSPITGPVIAPNANILVGCMNSKLYAYSSAGSLTWSYTATGGIVGPPATDYSSNIYFGTVDGYVFGLRGDGTPKWSSPLSTGIPPSVPASPVYASPNAQGDWNLYFAAQSGHVYCVNAATKAVNWVFKMTGAGYATPAVAQDGTVYVGDANGAFYAISSTGAQLWKYNTGNRILAKPTIGNNGEVYVGTYGSGLYAFNPDGTVRWRYTSDSLFTTSPTLGLDGSIYVCAYSGNVHALNPDGSWRWTLPTRDRLTGTPALDMFGRVYVAGADGFMRCIAQNGVQEWQYQVGTALTGSVALGMGQMYVSGTNNRLYAFDSPDLIPEPGTFASLIVLGGGTFVGVRRRMRRAR